MFTKAEALKDPASPWNRTKDDEPVFVICGRDSLAVQTLGKWCDLLSEAGGDLDKLDNARQGIREIMAWQALNGSKVPDGERKVEGATS